MQWECYWVADWARRWVTTMDHHLELNWAMMTGDCLEGRLVSVKDSHLDSLMVVLMATHLARSLVTAKEM